MELGLAGKTAVVTGDRKMAVLHHDKVTAHPRMNVAFDRNKFLVLVGIGKGGRAGELHLVPFAVDFGERVNIVRKGIAVRDLDFLADAHSEHMRRVVAALLVKDRRRRGHGRTSRRRG